MDFSDNTKRKTFFGFKTRKAAYVCIIIVFLCAALLAAIIALIIIVPKLRDVDPTHQPIAAHENAATTLKPVDDSKIEWPKPPSLESEGKYRYAAVACAEKNCSAIGTQMLAEGGSAVDAAISMSLCLGVYRSQSSGIGGGGFMTIYQRSTGKSYVFDFRERAGSLTNSTVYENSAFNQIIGGGSIATPGEIAGLWAAHQKFGRLDWSRLFQPSISLMENGIVLDDYVSGSLDSSFKDFDVHLKALYTNADSSRKHSGDVVKMTKLAETYRRIAQEGKYTYYNGPLKDDILADLAEISDVMVTESDLENYEVTERQPLVGELKSGEYRMISPPPPSGGVVLQYILRLLDGYNLNADTISQDKKYTAQTATTFHRIIEAWKFAYAKRSDLGDGSFVNNTETLKTMTDDDMIESIRQKITDDRTHDNLEYYGLTTDARLTKGTSQISVLAGNGDAVSFTTSVNYAWGSKRMGNRTGIIFNNHMGDFSLPNKPSWTDDAWTAPTNENNWIEPGKRPLSSMSPTVILDKDGDVRLVTGGSGGSKIITAAAMTIINDLWFGMGLPGAVSTPRLHHQLLPDNIFYEAGFPPEYLKELKKKGHNVTLNTYLPVSDSVSREDNSVYGVGDYRRLGRSDGL